MSFKTKCPNCGHNLVVACTSGRKCYDIDFKNISKALQAGMGKDGVLNQSAAARILSGKFGIRVTPGFVSNRLTREAETRGIERHQLITEILKPEKESIK